MPPKLLNQLQDILQRVTYFNTNNELRSLFINEQISAWKNQLPQADNVDIRIKRTIEYLFSNQNERGENALVLFLMVLSENIDTGDYLHGKVKELAEQINHHLTTSLLRNEIETHQTIANWHQHISMFVSMLVNGIVVGIFSGGLVSLLNIPIKKEVHAIVFGMLTGLVFGWIFTSIFKSSISWGVLEKIIPPSIHNENMDTKLIIGAIHGTLVGCPVVYMLVLIKRDANVPWLGVFAGTILGASVSIGIIVSFIEIIIWLAEQRKEKKA